MVKRKFALNAEHGFIGETKSKAKPKPYTHPQWLLDYWMERDRVIYKMGNSKQEILERYGK